MTTEPAHPAPTSESRWRLPLLLALLAATVAWSLWPQAPAAPPAAARRTPAADRAGLDVARAPLAVPTGAQAATGEPTAGAASTSGAATPRWREPLRPDVARGLFGAPARAAPPARPAANPPAAAAPAPVETPAVADPLPAWQALGVLRERGQPPQALLQVGGQLLVLKPGEIAAPGWRLDTIGATHLELTRADGTQRQRLPVQPGD